MDLHKLLILAQKEGASDLHLCPKLKPILRIDGDLEPVADHPVLMGEDIENAFADILSPEQQEMYAKKNEIDLVYTLHDVGGYRVNYYREEHGTAAALRLIPEQVVSLDSLGLPSVLKKIATAEKGLVLITGATGSGKTTTLAALIDYINETSAQHIITIEDPIEYRIKSKNCVINQREVQRDTVSFNNALRAALRQDPDVILVGEMRDLETIRLALTAAETGHLVFGTLHTMSAAKSITRIIDVFPGDEKNHVRQMLADSVEAIVCQSLCKRVEGGRVAAVEIMIANNAVRNMIRENKIAQMYSILQTNANMGMQTLDQHLMELVKAKAISPDTAKQYASSRETF